MSGRTQCRRCGTWWATPFAALCAALAVLFAAAVLCLGNVPHDGAHQTVAPMTTMSAAEHPARQQAVSLAHQADCPSGDVCCGSAVHAVRAVPDAPTQPVPAILPRMPGLPAPDVVSCSTHPPPIGGAPDLHVLQVQRT